MSDCDSSELQSVVSCGSSIKPKCEVNRPERWPTPDAMDATGKMMYIVERVLLSFETKVMQEKSVMALVKWQNYTYDESSWEQISPEICDLHIDTYVYRSAKMRDIRLALGFNVTPYFPYYRRACEFVVQILRLAQIEDEMNRRRDYRYMADILVENWFDDVVPPEFVYISHNNISEAAKAQLNGQMMKGVECDECFENGFCAETNCCAGSMNLPFPYMSQGETLNSALCDRPIVECSHECGCTIACPSRVVQRGRKYTLIVFREPFDRWSLRTGALIHEGAFVLQYVGEVLTIAEAEERRRNSPRNQYFMQTVTVKNAAFVIDSTEISNECRFLRHSCDPNLECHGVYASRKDERYQELGFFSTRRIEMGEELTVDFYAHLDADPSQINSQLCDCGAPNCRTFLSETRSPRISKSIPSQADPGAETPTVVLDDDQPYRSLIPDDKSLVRELVQLQLRQRRNEFANPEEEEWTFDSDGNAPQRFRCTKTMRPGIRTQADSDDQSSSSASSAASVVRYRGLQVKPRRGRMSAPRLRDHRYRRGPSTTTTSSTATPRHGETPSVRCRSPRPGESSPGGSETTEVPHSSPTNSQSPTTATSSPSTMGV